MSALTQCRNLCSPHQIPQSPHLCPLLTHVGLDWLKHRKKQGLSLRMWRVKHCFQLKKKDLFLPIYGGSFPGQNNLAERHTATWHRLAGIVFQEQKSRRQSGIACMGNKDDGPDSVLGGSVYGYRKEADAVHKLCTSYDGRQVTKARHTCRAVGVVEGWCRVPADPRFTITVQSLSPWVVLAWCRSVRGRNSFPSLYVELTPKGVFHQFQAG